MYINQLQCVFSQGWIWKGLRIEWRRVSVDVAANVVLVGKRCSMIWSCAHRAGRWWILRRRRWPVAYALYPVCVYIYIYIYIYIYTRWYPARCCENFFKKNLRWNVKVVTPKIFVCKVIIYASMLFCWEWIILKSPAGILWCDIHAISHRKSIEDINMWFGGWWHGV
jgi:hypothetical protein